MAEELDATSRHTVEVEFTAQQDIILTRLREEGRFGDDDATVIRSVFQEFLRQTQL